MIVIRRDLISAWERHDLGSPKSLFGILFIVDILLAALSIPWTAIALALERYSREILGEDLLQETVGRSISSWREEQKKNNQGIRVGGLMPTYDFTHRSIERMHITFKDREPCRYAIAKAINFIGEALDQFDPHHLFLSALYKIEQWYYRDGWQRVRLEQSYNDDFHEELMVMGFQRLVWTIDSHIADTLWDTLIKSPKKKTFLRLKTKCHNLHDYSSLYEWKEWKGCENKFLSITHSDISYLYLWWRYIRVERQRRVAEAVMERRNTKDGRIKEFMKVVQPPNFNGLMKIFNEPEVIGPIYNEFAKPMARLDFMRNGLDEDREMLKMLVDTLGKL